MRQQSLGHFAFQSLGFNNNSNFLYEDTNKLFNSWDNDHLHSYPYYKPHDDKQHIEEVGVIGVKQVRYVNEKQWERIMKRRVQKQFEKMRNLREADKKRYKYQSRHLHAQRRVRNQKGRFIKTRPEEIGQKIKKKRGRKSNKQKQMILQLEREARTRQEEIIKDISIKITAQQTPKIMIIQQRQ